MANDRDDENEGQCEKDYPKDFHRCTSLLTGRQRVRARESLAGDKGFGLDGGGGRFMAGANCKVKRSYWTTKSP